MSPRKPKVQNPRKLHRQIEFVGIKRGVLAVRLGVDRKTLASWEYGPQFPPDDALKKLAEELRCNVEDIRDGEANPVGRPRVHRDSEPEVKEQSRIVYGRRGVVPVLSTMLKEDGGRPLPVYGQVAATRLEESVELVEESPIYVDPTPLNRKGGVYFAFRVKGDSMVGKGLLDGDTAAALYKEPPKDRDVVVASRFEESTVKIYRENEYVAWLEASPPEGKVYEDIQIDQDVRIDGVVVGVIHPRSFPARRTTRK